MGQYLDDRAFLEALPIAFKELEVEGKVINHERADRIAAAAKQHVHVLSGETRDSIEVTVLADGDVEVGSHLEKAFYEEFGTHKMRPRPFMRPAIEEETH